MLPDNEPAWQVILDLKDIVELVVAPVHTNETIAYLEGKIFEHRHCYLELFPHVKLLPKHHYLFRALSANDLLLRTSNWSVDNEI